MVSPKSSRVTFLRFAYLRMGFQICQSNATQGRVWDLFQSRAADPLGALGNYIKGITSLLTYRLPVSESRASYKEQCILPSIRLVQASALYIS